MWNYTNKQYCYSSNTNNVVWQVWLGPRRLGSIRTCIKSTCKLCAFKYTLRLRFTLLIPVGKVSKMQHVWSICGFISRFIELYRSAAWHRTSSGSLWLEAKNTQVLHWENLVGLCEIKSVAKLQECWVFWTKRRVRQQQQPSMEKVRSISETAASSECSHLNIQSTETA